jgi:23S rRNA (adenine2503-C2)-methyltransferase
MQKINLKALTRDEAEGFMTGLGLPSYRTSQLLHWIYEKRAGSIEEITEFSKKLRAELNEQAYVSNLGLLDRQISSDGTEKFLFRLEDGLSVESVLIPAEDRITLCISSQVGCAIGCRFCLTGREGLKRNLASHEIVDQLILAGRLVSPQRIGNIVFMGMGEPLHNLKEVIEALWRMTDMMNISPRRITLSTSGVADRMLEFARKAPPVNLAISLNASIDDVRDAIMPINRRYPLRLLLDTCRKYPLQARRRITFEYILIQDVNDSKADARRLANILRGIPAKINIIPLNEFEGCELRRPSERTILDFQEVLHQAGLTAVLRKSRGHDILAACGQLRGGHRE